MYELAILVDPQGWGEALLPDIHQILLSVYRVFIPCFQETMNLHDVLIVHSADHPVTYRSQGVILLSAHDRFWCKYAYQFAHELCHFQIPAKVPQQLRWFEESLCELASYYFLPRISALWKTNPPYPNWRTYADHFTTYVQNDMQKAESFNLSLLDNPSVFEHLNRDEYDRKKNSYVALQLLPIFENASDLWSAIHLLSDIPDGLSLADSLRHWHSLTPEKHRNSIRQILQVFSIEI